MTDENTADPTTAETQTPEGPNNRSRSYGDPVIVDDGGSTRISHQGSQLNGLSTAAKKDNAGVCKAGSRLTVFSLGSAGPQTTSLLLQLGDVVQIATVTGFNCKLSVTTAGTLDIACSNSMDEHTHKKNGKSGYGYHAMETGKITSVTHTRNTQDVNLINSRFETANTVVCIEPVTT